MADAVFNVAHASLLVLGLAQGRLDLVARGLADRLHQPRRAALYPESMALVARATRVRRARRHDLGRRPDRAGVERSTTRRRGWSSGCGPRRTGWADVLRVPFEPQGADVRALTSRRRTSTAA